MSSRTIIWAMPISSLFPSIVNIIHSRQPFPMEYWELRHSKTLAATASSQKACLFSVAPQASPPVRNDVSHVFRPAWLSLLVMRGRVSAQWPRRPSPRTARIALNTANTGRGRRPPRSSKSYQARQHTLLRRAERIGPPQLKSDPQRLDGPPSTS